MTIQRRAWLAYIDGLSKVNEQAVTEMKAFLQTHLPLNEENSRLVIEYAFAISTKYGEAAASLACEMYDRTAAAQGATVPPAEPAATATYQETAKAVQGTAKVSETEVPQTVGRLVKQAGVDTTMQNAIRDGAEWAWIPHGDTCAFCITLASNGWQRASKAAMKGGHAEHIHANCDCSYSVRFDRKSTVAGYDPGQYRRIYEQAEGSTPEQKINAMRRAFYAENAEEINAQKRSAYAKRRERESSAAEEIEV